MKRISTILVYLFFNLLGCEKTNVPTKQEYLEQWPQFYGIWKDSDIVIYFSGERAKPDILVNKCAAYITNEIVSSSSKNSSRPTLVLYSNKTRSHTKEGQMFHFPVIRDQVIFEGDNKRVESFSGPNINMLKKYDGGQ